MGSRLRRLRKFSDQYYISCTPIPGLFSGGSLFMEAPTTAFSSVLLLLGFGASAKAPQGEPSDKGEEEEVVVYTSDTLDLVIKNYGVVPLVADFPYEAVDILGSYFEYLLEHPYEEIDGWGLTGFASSGEKRT